MEYYNEVPELQRSYECVVDTLDREQEDGFQDSSAEAFREDGSFSQRSTVLSPSPNETSPVPMHSTIAFETDFSSQYHDPAKGLTSQRMCGMLS